MTESRDSGILAEADVQVVRNRLRRRYVAGGRTGYRRGVRAYVGLGANLGDREATIRAGGRASRLVAGRRSSSESPRSARRSPGAPSRSPVPERRASRFETDLGPRALLELLLDVERRLGRRRAGERWGPRTIDLDLLLYDELSVDEPGSHAPSPSPPRAPVRARAARRARAGRVRPGPRPGQ